MIALLLSLLACAHLPTVPPGHRLAVPEAPPAKDAPPPMICVEPMPSPASGDPLAGVTALARAQSFDACMAMISGHLSADGYAAELQHIRDMVAEAARLQSAQEGLPAAYTTLVQRGVECHQRALQRAAPPEEVALCDQWQEAAAALLLSAHAVEEAEPPPPPQAAPTPASTPPEARPEGKKPANPGKAKPGGPKGGKGAKGAKKGN